MEDTFVGFTFFRRNFANRSPFAVAVAAVPDQSVTVRELERITEPAILSLFRKRCTDQEVDSLV